MINSAHNIILIKVLQLKIYRNSTAICSFCYYIITNTFTGCVNYNKIEKMRDKAMCSCLVGMTLAILCKVM